MSEYDKLVDEIERFLKRTDMSPTRFSIESVGDRAFMTRLKAGKGLTLDRVDRVRAYMRNYNAKKKPSLRVERVSA
jgi:hypothetical protein